MGRRLQFTLRALLAGVVISAILLLVTWRDTAYAVTNARRSSCKALLAQLEGVLRMYRTAFDDYPKTSAGLEALTKPRGQGREPYFENRVNGQTQERFLDPWGNPFVYRNRGQNAPCELYSIGPNGIDEGGKGDDVKSDD